MPPIDRHSRPRERGAVVIWFSFFVLVMMFFVALGVDGAKLAATRVQLQNAADAAALAGASAIDSLAGNGEIVQAVAVIRAQQTGFLNPAFIQGDEPVVIDAADITFPEPNQCQVVVRRQEAVGTGMLTAVAHIVGRPTLDMTATATAILEPASSVCELVPMGAVPPNANGFQVGCEYEYELKT